MKTSFNFHFYSRIVIIAIFVLGAYALQRSIQTKADLGGPSEEIHGWAWSELIGWVSLNCENDYDGDGLLESKCDDNLPYSNYAVSIDVVDAERSKVTGCAWAGNSNFGASTISLGWICFDDQGDPFNPPSGQSPETVTFAEDPNLVYSLKGTQYASIVEFEEGGYPVNAWQLGFPTHATTTLGANIGSVPPINGCFNCEVIETKNCSITTSISCNNDNDCLPVETNGTCVVVSVENKCKNCLEYFYQEEDVLGHNEGDLRKVIAGYDCTVCTIHDITNSCEMSAYRTNLNSCAVCGAFYDQPGVMVNYLENESDMLCGWAWNYDSGTGFGIGWLQFAPKITTSSNPYISVERGNIYSEGSIWSRYTPPIGKYNATYLIEAGGSITNFISSSTIAGNFPGELSGRPLLSFPSIITGGRYRNALGTIDYNGLTTPPNGINKYGSTVSTFSDCNIMIATIRSRSELNNEVFVSTDAAGCIISGGDLEILAGSSGTSGAGVIVVNGNLDIDENIVYIDDTFGNLQEIPSLVWIVEGDVTVAPTVTSIAGSFVVLGDGNNNCNPPVAGCGQFISGDDSFNPQRLIVNGSVMARYFDLGRTYGDASGNPSELFINDGRLQANPPLGISDFSKVVPRFSEAPN